MLLLLRIVNIYNAVNLALLLLLLLSKRLQFHVVDLSSAVLVLESFLRRLVQIGL